MGAWWRLSTRDQVKVLGWLEMQNDKPKRDRGPDRDPTPAEIETLRARALKHRVP